MIHLNTGWTWERSLLANNCLMWLMTLHKDNSGIPRPQPDDNWVAPMSPWEVHRRDRLIQGLLPDIQEHVKEHCVGYERQQEYMMWRNRLHMLKKKKDKKKKREKKKEEVNDKLLVAQLQV